MHDRCCSVQHCCGSIAHSALRPQAQALSNTAWALATLGHLPCGGLLEKLARRAADIISTFRPQATSNTLCAPEPFLNYARAHPRRVQHGSTSALAALTLHAVLCDSALCCVMPEHA